jgi:cytochrome P450
LTGFVRSINDDRTRSRINVRRSTIERTRQAAVDDQSESERADTTSMLTDHSGIDTNNHFLRIAETGRNIVDADTGELVMVRYADVRALLPAARLTTQRPQRDLLALDALPPRQRATQVAMKAHYAKWPLFSDGSYHKHLRRHLVNAMNDVVATVARDAAERVGAVRRETAEDRFSWLHRVAEPTAVSTIAAILGVPFGEAEILIGSATVIVRELAWPVMDDERAADAVRAQNELAAWLARRLPTGETPAGSTRYMRALRRIADDPSLGFPSAVAALAQTITGAYDPLVSVLTTLAIIAKPETLAGLPPAALVEEALRIGTPFRFARRFATEPTRLDDRDIPPYCRIFLGLATANLDPRTFPDPAAIRPRDSPHVAFGLGRHFCLGADVVRACLRGIVGALADVRHAFVAENVEYSPELSILRFAAADGRWRPY